MAVPIDVGTGEQVERMPAVKPNNGGNLETRERGILPGTINDRCPNNLVPLIEFGQSPFRGQVGVVLRPEVAVEVRCRVEGFAVRVISKQCEIVAEALPDLDNGAFVESGCLRRILVRLKNRGVYKARQDQCARASRTAPVPKGCGAPVGQWHARGRRWESVRINGYGKLERMGIDPAQRNGKVVGDFALNAKGRLLGIRILIARLAAENYRQQWKGTCVGDRDSELGQIRRRNAGGGSGSGSSAGYFSFAEQRLENACGEGRG